MSATVKKTDGYYMRGNVNQLIDQANFLRKQGFSVYMDDMYPVLKDKAEFKRALAKIWECRVNGWQNYKKELVDNNVCTEAQFLSALGRR